MLETVSKTMVKAEDCKIITLLSTILEVACTSNSVSCRKGQALMCYAEMQTAIEKYVAGECYALTFMTFGMFGLSVSKFYVWFIVPQYQNHL